MALTLKAKVVPEGNQVVPEGNQVPRDEEMGG